ncbi:MAG TPA: DUF503 domain-containing protein [Polyangia bacterium]|nr:DUF503 domain-containing protein [Polyangia bacterium]
MFVGVCRITLRLEGIGSLKAKRSVVRRAVERTRAKFNATVAEVDANDSLSRTVIGAAVVSNSAAHTDAMLARICSFVEWLALAPVTDIRTEVIALGDGIGEGDPGPRRWEGDREDDAAAEEEPW